MNLRTLSSLFTLLAIVAACWPRKSRNGDDSPKNEQDPAQLRVTRETIDGREVLRFRGSFDDVMNALNPSRPVEARPTVPTDLNLESLPAYRFGCPHCGKMSSCGEGFWRYQELERTRGYMDNTTTFLMCCKKCQGWLRATVDHDD